MANILLSPLRSSTIITCYVMIGFLLNGLMHLYRFKKIGWTQVTGLFGQPQSIMLSFVVCCWVIFPMLLSKYLVLSIRNFKLSLFLFAILFIVLSQLSGRSMLKLIFDIVLIGILAGWFLLDITYGSFTGEIPSDKSFPYIISELMAIFQTSLAMLTFVIATFGFSFAPNYIEKYYHQEIGQPTVWWFSLLTVYLTLGILSFISLHAWAIAVKMRSLLT